MRIKQLSIMLANKEGALAAISDVLARNNVNMHAMIIADTQDFGLLRIIVDDVDAVAALLQKEGYVYTKTEVLALPVANHSGALAQQVAALAAAGIGIEYAYAFSSTAQVAYAVFRVDDNDAAERLLGDAKVEF